MMILAIIVAMTGLGYMLGVRKKRGNWVFSDKELVISGVGAFISASLLATDLLFR